MVLQMVKICFYHKIMRHKFLRNMAVWSSLCRGTGQILYRNNKTLVKNQPINQLRNVAPVRFSHDHRIFPMKSTNWYWDKSKDLFHLYFCIGAIPLGILVFCCNIFIGPAQLSPIPEGHEPKYWEYHRHPITRFISRYCRTSPEQEYEKFLHFIWAESETAKIRELENKINQLIKERIDYQHLYYEPYTSAKYIRKSAQLEKDQSEIYASASVD